MSVIDPNDPYIIASVCPLTGKRLLIESQSDIHKAQKARDILTAHEERNNRDPNKIKIFRADLEE